MIRLRRSHVATLLFQLALMSSAAAADNLPDMVWELNKTQNRIATGDLPARQQAKRQLERIEEALQSLPPEAWTDVRNTRAAAIYLLCGGSSQALRQRLESRLIPEQSFPLIFGSLAYSEGHNKVASKLLAPLDAKSFPQLLGGHIALVQGALASGFDDKKAARLFDLARLLMPSSLVEEAALRREIAILDPVKDAEKYLLLGDRYVSNYSASPFAKNFWNAFSAATLKIAIKLDNTQLDRFQDILSIPASPDKIDVALAIARNAILNAEIALATKQISRARHFASSPMELRRVKLYESITDAIASGFDDGAPDFQSLDQGSLPSEDVELLKIIAGASRVLHSSQRPPRKGAPEQPSSALDETANLPSPVAEAAERALNETEADIKKAVSR